MGNQPTSAVRVLCPRPLPVLQPSHRVAALAQAHSPVLLAAPLPSAILLICAKSLSRHSLTTGELLTKVDYGSTITSACLGQDAGSEALVLVAAGSIVEILSATSLSVVGRLDHSPFPICSVNYYSEGKVFVGLSSGKILQWSLQTQTPTVQYYTEGCTQFLVCSQRHKLLAADHFLAGHSNIVLYQEATGIALQELSRLEGRCLGLDFLDRRNLVLALGTGAVLLGWDSLSGNPLFSLSLSATFPQATLRALVCLPLAQDLLLLCTNTGIIVAALSYDFTDMQFTMDIQGRLAMTETPVVGCMYSSETDTLVAELDTQGAEALGAFSQAIAGKSAEPQNLPLFSLHQVPIPPKPEREKQDLPFFDLGLSKSKPQKPAPQPSASPKLLPSEETMQKIRSRVEGRPSQPRTSAPVPAPIVLPDEKSVPKRTEPVNLQTTFEAKPEKAASPPKSGPSEESLQKIRARLEGRPSRTIVSTVQDTSTTLQLEAKPEIEPPVPLVKQVEDVQLQAKLEVPLALPASQSQESKPEEEQKDLPPSAVEKETEPPAPAPKALESAPAPRVETSFERFLRIKKAELKQDNPALTTKEIVFKVSELWGALTEEEQADFEASGSS